MKIVHFTLSFLPQLNGLEIVVHNLALQQMMAGHNSYVMTSRSNWKKSRRSVPYTIIPFLPKTNINFLLKPTKRSVMKNYFEFQLSIAQKIHRFDIWHIHMAYPAGCACVKKLKSMNCPVVLTSHGNDIQTLSEIGYGARLNPEVDMLLRKNINCFDAIVAISNSMRQEFLNLKCSGDRITNIPNGVHAKRIIEFKVNKQEIRKRHGLPTDRRMLLTVGRNHPKKGYHMIPAIAKKLVESKEQFTWVLVGNDMEPIINEVKRIGIDGYFYFLDHIGQLKGKSEEKYMLPALSLIEIFKASDAFVFPTQIEAMPLVLIEAMAAGLPIITTNAPGACDVVEDNISGFISPIGDVGAMSDNILHFFKNEQLSDKFSVSNQRIAKQYEWQFVSEQYIELYKKLAQ